SCKSTWPRSSVSPSTTLIGVSIRPDLSLQRRCKLANKTLQVVSLQCQFTRRINTAQRFHSVTCAYVPLVTRYSDYGQQFVAPKYGFAVGEFPTTPLQLSRVG